MAIDLMSWMRAGTLAKLALIGLACLLAVTAVLALRATAEAQSIGHGSFIRQSGTDDVYRVKIVNGKRYKWLILNEAAFCSYGCPWGSVRDVSWSVMNRYTTSNLARRGSDVKVWRFTARGDTGTRQWLNMTPAEFEAAGFDWDAVHSITTGDFNEYTEGTALTCNDYPGSCLRKPVVDLTHSSLTYDEGAQVSAQRVATVSDQDTPLRDLTVTVSGLPSGLRHSFSTSSGRVTISGTLASGTAGTHQVTVWASDGRLSDDDTFRIRVRPGASPPIINIRSDQSFDAGQRLSSVRVATVSDQDTPLRNLSVTVNGLPRGLSYSFNRSNGRVTISGTVSSSAPRRSRVTVTANDGTTTATERFTIYVAPPNRPPEISGTSDRTWQEGQRVSSLQVATVTDRDNTLRSRDVTVSGLPSGLTKGSYRSSDGRLTITGTVESGAAGTYTVTVQATDGVNTPVERMFEVRVLGRQGEITDGSFIRQSGTDDVYRVKIVNGKRYKWLILNEAAFCSYGCPWGSVRDVSWSVMNRYTTSNLARRGSDVKVWRFTARGDTGTRQWLNMTPAEFEAAGFDWDAVHSITTGDFNEYTEGTALTCRDFNVCAPSPTTNPPPIVATRGNFTFERGEDIGSLWLATATDNEPLASRNVQVSGLPPNLRKADYNARSGRLRIEGTVSSNAREQTYTVTVSASDGTNTTRETLWITISRSTSGTGDCGNLGVLAAGEIKRVVGEWTSDDPEDHPDGDGQRYFDRCRFELTSPSTVAIELSSGAVDSSLTVASTASPRHMQTIQHGSPSKPARVSLTLPTGSYYIYAATLWKGHTGGYVLRATIAEPLEFASEVGEITWQRGIDGTRPLPGASGGLTPYTYSLHTTSGDSAPEGMTFNANTRTLSGAPLGEVGRHRITYRVTDAMGFETEQTFRIKYEEVACTDDRHTREEPLAPGELWTREGEWTSTDCVTAVSEFITDHIGHYRDIYSFRVSRATEVAIDLKSDDVGTYIHLLDNSGRLVQLTDASSDGNNARVTASLQPNETYWIRATTAVAGATGDYTLEVRGSEGNEAEAGVMYLGVLKTTTSEHSTWDIDDCEDRDANTRVCRRQYQFTLVERDHVTVRFFSDGIIKRIVVHRLNGNQKSTLLDRGFSLLVLEELDPGTYTVTTAATIITDLWPALGDYGVQIILRGLVDAGTSDLRLTEGGVNKVGRIYSPVLRLDEDEQFIPVPIEAMLENSWLLRTVPNSERIRNRIQSAVAEISSAKSRIENSLRTYAADKPNAVGTALSDVVDVLNDYAVSVQQSPDLSVAAARLTVVPYVAGPLKPVADLVLDQVIPQDRRVAKDALVSVDKVIESLIEQHPGMLQEFIQLRTDIRGQMDAAISRAQAELRDASEQIQGAAAELSSAASRVEDNLRAYAAGKSKEVSTALNEVVGILNDYATSVQQSPNLSAAVAQVTLVNTPPHEVTTKWLELLPPNLSDLTKALLESVEPPRLSYLRAAKDTLDSVDRIIASLISQPLITEREGRRLMDETRIRMRAGMNRALIALDDAVEAVLTPQIDLDETPVTVENLLGQNNTRNHYLDLLAYKPDGLGNTDEWKNYHEVWQDTYSPTAYVRVTEYTNDNGTPDVSDDEEWKSIQWWFFWLYNNADATSWDHEGDWEAVTLWWKDTEWSAILGSDGVRPTEVGFSAHEHGYYIVPSGTENESCLNADWRKPIAYVAANNHPMFVVAGHYGNVPRLDPYYRKPLQDPPFKIGFDEIGFDEARGTGIALSDYEVSLLDTQEWFPWTGHWGHIDDAPPGPGHGSWGDESQRRHWRMPPSRMRTANVPDEERWERRSGCH